MVDSEEMAIVRRYRARAERRRRRHQRLYRPRVILNDFRDRDVFPRFRFMRETVVFLINMFAPALGTPTMRSCPILAATQVMAALRFFATGAHFRLVGDLLGVSEASVSRAVYSHQYPVSYGPSLHQIPSATRRQSCETSVSQDSR